MGSYLNPGNKRFIRAISGTKYVDKTLLIAKTNEWMNSSKNLICASRPRRFGKTLAATMLAAYYSRGCQSESLFINRNIGAVKGFYEHLNKHNVIYIDVGGEYSATDPDEVPKLIRIMTDKVIGEIKAEFPNVIFGEKDSLGEAIRKVYAANGTEFIIILDEYDALVRENVGSKLINEYLLFLNGLFKNETVLEAVSLAYLTGILPIIKDRMQSKLNNFKPQYTFLDAGELAPFIGFTSEETSSLCEEKGMDFAECRSWYNGYSLNGIEIYNPESVMLAYETGKYANYWSRTSTFQVISDRISEDFYGMREDVLKMIGGIPVEVDADAYLNTLTDFTGKDDVFTYLIHLGYLSYDSSTGTCRIPNREILLEWIRAIKRNKKYTITSQIINESKDLLQSTIEGNEAAVGAALGKAHIHVTSNRSYNNEDGLQCAIYLAYIYALNEYTVVREVTAGHGFADMVYIPLHKGLPAMIIELKRNRNPKSAVDQIREKRYFESLEHYHGNLLFVGINYDEKKKTHSCKIERYVV